MSTFKGVTARVAHFCSGCQWHAKDGDIPVIAPGHRYIRHVGFPGDEGHEEVTRPWVLRQCIACVCESDDGAYLDTGACGSYCHGTTPCALPSERGAPGHEHACRECVLEAAA